MTTELRNKIIAWKTEDGIVFTREVFKMKNSLIANEYRLKVKQTVKITYGQNSIIVSVEKLFQTQAQSNSKLNTNGDILLFDKAIQNLELEFDNKYQKAVDELLGENTEEPFE